VETHHLQPFPPGGSGGSCPAVQVLQWVEKHRIMNQRRRVVVTGLGLVTSLGLDVEESWQKALTGTSGIRRLSSPLSETSPIQAAGEVVEADRLRIEKEFKEEAETEGERKTLFALWAAKRALKDADLLEDRGANDCYGVLLASGLGINRLEDILTWTEDDRTFDVVRFGRECSQVHRESIIRNNSNRTAALPEPQIRSLRDECQRDLGLCLRHSGGRDRIPGDPEGRGGGDGRGRSRFDAQSGWARLFCPPRRCNHLCGYA